MTSAAIDLDDTVAGDDEEFLLTVRIDGALVNLSAYQGITFLATDRKGNEIRKTLSSGITLLEQSGATLGQAVIAISRTDTAQWDPDLRRPTRLFVDVITVNGAGKRKTIIDNEQWNIKHCDDD